ncbi:streptomycin biosynthesis protein (oxidoreductase) [Colletotrichum truncatum]|uniref:Streptomycin biosynthesis protein (Oxidoreductase) n=1 Tax=Colletotrichum truncatum TaxID=5467 RepID=A0ACC3YX17_COLTU|nr:streptomycin biosynthesis protein (oxidoreductase) [Colletotrichum truncatum]KAF6781526.1 streptomycin biosynthesis protein (oxidoreductase) [Colletotrichum truncatum]
MASVKKSGSPVAVTQEPTIVPPEKPEMSASPPRILIIGAGSRGQAYAHATQTSSNGVVAAVAEPISYKRQTFGRTYIWGSSPPQDGQQFSDWRDFVTYETRRRERESAGESVPPGVDAVFICVLDEMHRDVVIGLAPLGLHVMCEKPFATTLGDCLDMYKALKPPAGQEPKNVFSIGHVLRYSPHNMLLRKLLLEERVVGEIINIVHTEPVGWWHFTHSYVRGNWRNEKTTAPSLLTKSCHDIDLILWLLSAPTKAGKGSPHLPSTVSSTGSLQLFRKSRKPAAAGDATNCLSCPLGDEGCKYSAKNIYLGPNLQGLGSGNTNWPVSIVLPEIEDFGTTSRNKVLASKLAEDYDETTPQEIISSRNWFGRCVFDADNNVCDQQTVTINWDDDLTDPETPKPSKSATLHMIAHTKKICERYTHIYGVDGEIYADSRSINIENFNTGTTQTYYPTIEDAGHGGGDKGLARQFILAVDRVKNHGWTPERAQNEYIGCSLEEVIRSHAMVFAAEEARTGKRVVDWEPWWSHKIASANSE